MTGKRTSIFMALAALAFVAGCGSDAKSPTSLDTSPPSMPTGLRMGVVGGVATLTWDANTTDTDFAGFRLARVAGSERAELIGQPEIATSFVDPIPSRGVLYRYELTAVDDLGNESACAVVGVTLGMSHDGPTPSDGSPGDPPWIPGGSHTPRAPDGDPMEP